MAGASHEPRAIWRAHPFTAATPPRPPKPLPPKAPNRSTLLTSTARSLASHATSTPSARFVLPFPAALNSVIDAGAEFIPLGSPAFLDPDLLLEACRRLPGRVIGSLDVRNGRLAIKGWVETSQLTV